MRARFSPKILESLNKAMIIGIRAGRTNHRFIGIWVVVTAGRAFVRSWSIKPNGWYRTFCRDPEGRLNLNGRTIPIRTVRIRGERIKGAVSRAYKMKYNSPGSLRYVRDLSGPNSRSTTMELIPRTH